MQPSALHVALSVALDSHTAVSHDGFGSVRLRRLGCRIGIRARFEDRRLVDVRAEGAVDRVLVDPGGDHALAAAEFTGADVLVTALGSPMQAIGISELADEGAIATRKVGSGRVWWPANADDETE